MDKIELKSAPELKRVILAAFPRYKKHNGYLSGFRPIGINSYWDGGSRDEYALVDLATMRTRQLPTATHPYYDVARHEGTSGENDVLSIDARGNITLKMIPDNCALVSAGTFCGKAATAHVYVNTDNLTKLIAA